MKHKGIPLSGRTSNRLRSGDIPADPLAPRTEVDLRPRIWAVLYGRGYGLGEGASRRRDGHGDATHG